MRKLRNGILLSLTLCLIAGCGTPSEETNQNLTPTEVVQSEITPEATATPAPTATPTPSPEDLYWQEVLESFSTSKYDLTDALTGTSLKDMCADYFKLGVALSGNSYQTFAIHSKEYMAITEKHFNSVTLANLMKPSNLLDQRASKQNIAAGIDEPVLDFTLIEEALQWCMDHDVQMRGHTIVWHTQTPDWYFREGFTADGEYVDRDTMLNRLDSYMKQLMTYCQENYPGVVYCWDVVNEAVDPSNGDPNSDFRCRMENDGEPNPWYYVVGPDYPEQAFRIARKYAAEGVALYYNDYGTYSTVKREYIYNLCKGLAEQGLIDGIGMQGNWSLGTPSIPELEMAIKRYAELGLEIQITELSINAEDLTEDGLEKHAQRYSSIFYMLSYLDTDGGGPANITAVTQFGLMDNYLFYGGSDTTTSRMFDGNFQTKPMFYSVKKMFEIAYKKKTE